jgi:rare lipoprotein A
MRTPEKLLGKFMKYSAVLLSALTVLSAQVFAQSAPAPAAATVPATPAAAPAAAVAPATAPATAPKAAVAPKAASGDHALEGKLAHYGAKFRGRKTASGERFNPDAMTMAHRTLPFGSMVKVTNNKNKRSVVVRVTDRGPSTPDRIADVTTAAARKLGMIKSGVVDAKLEVVGKRAVKKAVKKIAKKVTKK